MRIEHDGYWMYGSVISELTLWEADVDGDVVGSDWERDTMDSRVHVG